MIKSSKINVTDKLQPEAFIIDEKKAALPAPPPNMSDMNCFVKSSALVAAPAELASKVRAQSCCLPCWCWACCADGCGTPGYPPNFVPALAPIMYLT